MRITDTTEIRLLVIEKHKKVLYNYLNGKLPNVLGRTMKHTDKMEVVIKKTFSVGELWEAVFGSEGSGSVHWSSEIRNAEGQDIDLWITNAEGELVGNPQDFKVYEDEESKWHAVSLEQLRSAYEKALTDGLTHCGGSRFDLEDSDECIGDTLIQLAVFGEVTYG